MIDTARHDDEGAPTTLARWIALLAPGDEGLEIHGLDINDKSYLAHRFGRDQRSVAREMVGDTQESDRRSVVACLA
jgi:hypothetical protein